MQQDNEDPDPKANPPERDDDFDLPEDAGDWGKRDLDDSKSNQR